IEGLVADIERNHQPPAAVPDRPEQIRLQLEGELFAGHSFSNVNEQLALRFGPDSNLAFSIRRMVMNPTHDKHVAHAPQIAPFITRPLTEAPQVVIRHSFPPNWDRPATGHWVHIQPWEFGALPRDWVPQLLNGPSEIWAPSNYVKDVYVRSGIPAEK